MAVIALLACGKRDKDHGSGGSAASATTDSADLGADLPSDGAVPYGRCDQACRSEPGFACSECSNSGCAEPELSGVLSVCNALCETAGECPEPPGHGKTVCIDEGCYVDCDAGPCPEGQTCVHFLNLTDPRVCMYLGEG